MGSEFTIDLTVVQKPVKVTFTCPCCSEEIEIDFSTFLSIQTSAYQGDWSELECTECGALNIIREVLYD